MSRPTKQEYEILAELELQHQQSFEEVKSHLADMFPKGTHWKVLLNSRQKKPSVMEVIGYLPSGNAEWTKVTFKMPRKNDKYGRWTIKDVLVSRIIERY